MSTPTATVLIPDWVGLFLAFQTLILLIIALYLERADTRAYAASTPTTHRNKHNASKRNGKTKTRFTQTSTDNQSKSNNGRSQRNQ